MMQSRAKLVADVVGHIPNFLKELIELCLLFSQTEVALARQLNWKSLDNCPSQREAWR